MQKYDCTGEQGARVAWERRKVAKIQQSNAAIKQMLPKRDRQMQRVSESCKNEIIRENRVPVRRGGEQKLLKCDYRMLQLSKSCQNATVEYAEYTKAAKSNRTRDGGAGAAWEGRKVVKMRLLNAAIEQKLPNRDRHMLSEQK